MEVEFQQFLTYGIEMSGSHPGDRSHGSPSTRG